MNKQIKQLVEQATTIHEYGWGASYAEFDQEKFADMIVQECVAIANRQFSAATGLDDRDCLTAQQMKQHFGVGL